MLYNDIENILVDYLTDNVVRNYNLLFSFTDLDIISVEANDLLFNPHTNKSIKKELLDNKKVFKKKIKRALLTEDKKQVKNVIYSKRYNRIYGDASKTIRLADTEFTRTTVEAKNLAMKNISVDTYKTWVYTYRSEVPRPSHLNANGLKANSRGYFEIDGYLTKGPGQFGVPEEDINCQCDIDVFVRPN